MKHSHLILISAFTAIFLVSTLSLADGPQCLHSDVWVDCDSIIPPTYDGPGCAPEVVQNNFQKADGVFAQLATNELKDSETFKSKAAAIAAMPISKGKSDAYFALAGLTNPSASDILNFLYARQIDPKSLTAVMNNLHLTSDQANLVINRMTAALQPR